MSINFTEKFEYYCNLIETEIEKHCEIPNCDERVIYEAMAYSLKAGGKRIRPVLTLAVCDMLGGDIQAALPFAVAIEMIHTYSLIHDDLPCMDNDDLRRGKPTCHKVFGEAVAVLAGDALLTKAFEVVSNPEIAVDISTKDRLAMVYINSLFAGSGGMIGGQVLDMLFEGGGRVVTSEMLQIMNYKKTSLLICAAVNAGLTVANASNEEAAKLSQFAGDLGLAFQIRDDILDLIGDAESLGKNVGMDIERGKATFVTVLGLDGAAEMLERLTAEAIAEISYFGEEAEFLVELTNYLLNREN